jgi:hypothetical protein
MRRNGLAVALLLGGLLCVLSGCLSFSTLTVLVGNHSQDTLKNVTVQIGDQTISCGTLAPGKGRRATVRPGWRAKMSYSYEVDGKVRSAKVPGVTKATSHQYLRIDIFDDGSRSTRTWGP